MKLVPYDHPQLPEFTSTSFRRSTARWKRSVEELLFDDKTYVKGLQDLWVTRAPAPFSQPWTPKLYVCVGAKSYWPMIIRLIEHLQASKLTWKFFMAPRGYERPDKICFYFRSAEELRRFVLEVRPLMPKRGTHTLRHTASTSEFGLEGEGARGLAVGLDPPLAISWRMYRCFCVAWAELNREYIVRRPGGWERWFRRMNISLTHEGPDSLTPNPKDLTHVRRFWSSIDPYA